MPLPVFFYALGATVIRTGAVKAAKELLKKGFKKLTKPSKTQINNAVSIQSAAAKKFLKNAPKASVKSNKGKNLAKVLGGVTGVATAVKVGSDIAKEMSKDKIKDSGGKEDAKQKSMEKSYKRKGKDIGDAEDSIRKNRNKRNATDDGTVSPKLVGARSPKAKSSQVSAGPGEISNDQYPQRSERSRERLRNVRGKDVITKSAGSKSDTSNQEDSMDPDSNQKYHNLNKGGTIKKKYGMRAGGFTKRGGMYKKGY